MSLTSTRKPNKETALKKCYSKTSQFSDIKSFNKILFKCTLDDLGNK